MTMMGENGLGKSAWASSSDSAPFQRTQNRKCHSCGISNFSEGAECFRCAHNPKISNDSPADTSGSRRTALAPRSNGPSVVPSWSKPKDSTINHKSIGQDSPNRPDKVGINRDNGLSTSRWAPRNYQGNSRAVKDQVWTRTVHQPISKNHPTLSTAAFPDQDLPYQVQHYILVMIQRILEEGCFDVAQRWIPDALHANRWDCPEAVELSKWREFLPTSLPPNAIKPLSSYTLEMALGHAVQIRNKAVHRHLCDNNEIRRMALQVQDLMYMFSDTTRSEKMHHLWVELNHWDLRNREDPQGARQTLEAVLKVISERPIDDMDWTPNAVSLQEVTSEPDAQQILDGYGCGEQMDLD